jgi:hypothetical protein
MPDITPAADRPADGDISVTIRFWLAFRKGPPRSMSARYVIECNRCRQTRDYAPAPHDAACSLPLAELQCPNDCEDRDTDIG